MWFRRSSQPNAICPYCYSLTTLAPDVAVVCGFCESELMRGMNFFVPLADWLSQHSLTDLATELEQAKTHLKTCTTKTARFYAKDHIASLKRVMALKRAQLN